MISPIKANSNVGFIFFVKLKTKERNKIIMLIALQPSAINTIFRPFINRFIVLFVESKTE